MISTTFAKLLQTASAHQLPSKVPITLPLSRRHLMQKSPQERQNLGLLLLTQPILRIQQPQLRQ